MRGENVYFRLASLLLLVFVTGLCHVGYSQNRNVTIQVLDSAQVPVANATIKINHKESLVDSTGRLQLPMPAGKYHIVISAVGHTTASFNLNLFKDTTLQVMLRSRESLLQNVFVTANRHVHRNQM